MATPPSDLAIDLSIDNLMRVRKLSPADRQQEFQKMQQKLDALAKSSDPLPPPMQPSEYLTALIAVNLADPDSFYDFLGRTQSLPEASLPKLVPLGTHGGVRYFIQSSDQTLTQTSPTTTAPSGQDLYWPVSAFEAKKIPHGTTVNTDLRYGFGLGRLWYQASNHPSAADAGFYLICNAVDKSIWASFDFNPYSDTGEKRRIQAELGEIYGKLPVGDSSNATIGLQRLFGREWTAKKPPSLDGGDPFQSGAGTPLQVRLVARPATKTEVMNAIQAGA
ncbi:hypothetical protein F4803DRAFT_555658 [Xylaria telfairii]|nr:hypothetical protein F4803DRAFT_555658 [Xylaria telfairii]